MDGYDERSYGDAFADVYDDWYADVSDVAATVDRLLALADGHAVLELGVGTGRIAVPLALAGRESDLRVVGIDTSEAMLDRLRRREGADAVDSLVGNMMGPLPEGPFGLVVVAYNTLFNLTGPNDQAACFTAVADALLPGGRFAIEAFVPDESDRLTGLVADADTGDVSLRTLAADRVVLSVSRRDRTTQLAEGQFIEITEAGGVRLRPWSIRYRTPMQLDEMATDAGFELESRWASFAGEPFTADAGRHVTVYRKPLPGDAPPFGGSSALS